MSENKELSKINEIISSEKTEVKKIRSLLDEMELFIPCGHKKEIIEARAGHLINSASYLIDLIEDSYSLQESEELTRKLILAIRARNPNKFLNKIRRLPPPSSP